MKISFSFLKNWKQFIMLLFSAIFISCLIYFVVFKYQNNRGYKFYTVYYDDKNKFKYVNDLLENLSNNGLTYEVVDYYIETENKLLHPEQYVVIEIKFY